MSVPVRLHLALYSDDSGDPVHALWLNVQLPHVPPPDSDTFDSGLIVTPGGEPALIVRSVLDLTAAYKPTHLYLQLYPEAPGAMAEVLREFGWRDE